VVFAFAPAPVQRCARRDGGNASASEALRAISDIGDPRLVKALAHPLRVQILGVLEERVASPSDLAEELGAPLGNVSYHVRTLAELGLLKLVRRRTRRGAVEHYYQARGRATVSNQAWSQVPSVVRRSMVGVALEQAVEHAAAAAANGGFDGEDTSVTRHSLNLDDEGVREACDALAKLHDELAAIQERSAERRDGSASDGRQLGLVTMVFDGQAADASHAAASA
jgi:DNA-binding transcriptional ArsR family regulator